MRTMSTERVGLKSERMRFTDDCPAVQRAVAHADGTLRLLALARQQDPQLEWRMLLELWVGVMRELRARGAETSAEMFVLSEYFSHAGECAQGRECLRRDEDPEFLAWLDRESKRLFAEFLSHAQAAGSPIKELT